MHAELKVLRESQQVLQREVTLQQGLEAQFAQRSALQVAPTAPINLMTGSTHMTPLCSSCQCCLPWSLSHRRDAQCTGLCAHIHW